MNRIELERKIRARKEALVIKVKALESIADKLDFLNVKVKEAGETYGYWLDYVNPCGQPSDRSIDNAYSQWMSWVDERKNLLASVGY